MYNICEERFGSRKRLFSWLGSESKRSPLSVFYLSPVAFSLVKKLKYAYNLIKVNLKCGQELFCVNDNGENI